MEEGALCVRVEKRLGEGIDHHLPGNAHDYRNPWPSWHEASLAETWNSLQWGQRDDPSVELAASHLPEPGPAKPDPSKLPSFCDLNGWPDSIGAQAAQLLRIEDPDFSFDPASQKAKVTWLGHAGTLVQLRPLKPGHNPIRCLFDPIFSMRCSPIQAVGPTRSYPPPCPVSALPPIDVVFISHNHYDHFDRDTLLSVSNAASGRTRFFVPLGNKMWLEDYGISNDAITELDWWGTAHLLASDDGLDALKVTCTPAQHSSGRSLTDNNTTLWCGWYLEHQIWSSTPTAAGPGAAKADYPFRVYFAGDTGYQFHASPSWPPDPPPASAETPQPPPPPPPPEAADAELYPVCPAFADIRRRLGVPDLLLLPVSVGATYAYLRSLVPLPGPFNPVPRHSAGVSAAMHLPPWDAVAVLKVLAGAEGVEEGRPAAMDGEGDRPVAVAVHWGTFVTEPVEVLRTLGQLEWACKAQGVRFGRSLEEGANEGGGKGPVFLAINHGQSVDL